jgi:flagellar biosynthesis/type III secretory pathway M-ring protein FliF/YscJ
MVAAIAAVLVVFSSVVTADNGMVRVAGLEDLDQVRGRLEEKGRRYEVRADGVYVPKGEAENALGDLVVDDFVTSDKTYKFLGESNLFSNDWERKARLRVANQQRLERLIRKFEPVRNVGVQLTPGSESRRFGKRGHEASASVVVELNPGAELTRQNVAAISGLVAGAVQGLEADRVHVMDTQGKAYRQTRRNTETMFPSDLHDLEAQIADRVKREIEEAFPFEVRVIAGVQLRHSTTSRKEERVVDPQVVEEERRRTVEEQIAPTQQSPIKGATDLTQRKSAATVQKVKEDEAEKIAYEHGTSNVETHEPAGEVERVTLGILIPVSEDAGEKRIGQLEGMKPQIRKLARAAAPQAAEEDIEVLVVPTRAPAALPPPVVEEQDPLAAITSEPWFPYAAIGCAAVVVLLVLWMLVRMAAPQKVIEEMSSLRRLVEETPVAAAESGADEENLRLRLGVQDLVARSPRGAGAVLKRWLKGER